ncbi:hypothetical protein QR680_017587 [Steinernema hermaphroditum]|uniref:Uncharacterized protein n=1 Tax=Steinernema hermaphroditum TaxID=289476 RepID=A0AA39HF44_9BILA|nr:hypothetical protein QR680_017587 [Steinernema hermaphroditum]
MFGIGADSQKIRRSADVESAIEKCADVIPDALSLRKMHVETAWNSVRNLGVRQNTAKNTEVTHEKTPSEARRSDRDVLLDPEPEKAEESKVSLHQEQKRFSTGEKGPEKKSLSGERTLVRMQIMANRRRRGDHRVDSCHLDDSESAITGAYRPFSPIFLCVDRSQHRLGLVTCLPIEVDSTPFKKVAKTDSFPRLLPKATSFIL